MGSCRWVRPAVALLTSLQFHCNLIQTGYSIHSAMNFDGKRVLVTGASRGIGRQLALTLNTNGATVVAMGRDIDQLQSLQDESNNSIAIVQCDLAIESYDLIRDKLHSFQPFHYLVNSAGIGELQSFLDFTVNQFDRTMAINLRAPAIVSQIIAKEMIANSIRGSIVHISSQASVRPLLDHTAYCVSKAGLDMLAKMMAMELGEHGIRVNCVNPTVVMTEMSRKIGLIQKKHKIYSIECHCDDLQVLLNYNFITPRIIIEVDEVVNACIFLLSDLSSCTTGSIFPVDGGYMNS